MSRVELSLQQKFRELTSKSFVAQAKWFLNGFWNDVQQDAEFVWKCVHLCHEISKNKAKGNELDEFEAHRFLEKLGETLSVAEMREKLRDIDVDFNKMMALSEYLIFKYKKSVKEVVESPQGGNLDELKQAEALVAASQKAFDELTEKTEAQKVALAAQRQAEEEAAKSKADADAASATAKVAAEEAVDASEKAKLKEAQATESAKIAKEKAIESENESVNASRKLEESKEAQANAQAKEAESKAASAISNQAQESCNAAYLEQVQALKELKDIEDALAAKLAELEAKSQDGPIVARGRAKAELEQLKSGDSLPLRRAKINQEAAVRRFQKAEGRAKEEADKASTALSIAVASASLATETKNQAEVAAASAVRAHEEAVEAEKHASQDLHSSSMAAAASSAAASSALSLAAASETAAKLAADDLQSAQTKRLEAEETANKLAIALEDATGKFKAAMDFLTEVKSKPDQANGEIWWLERELIEKQKYLPQSQQRKF